MLNFDPTSSSQNAERQRRQSAEEKSRVNRLADASTLRESQARVVAEAPSEADVERFRALMSGSDKSSTQSARNKLNLTNAGASNEHASPSAQSTHSPGSGAASLADQYRAMLLVSDAVGRAAGDSDDDATESSATSGGRQTRSAGDDAGKVANSKGSDATHSPPTDVGDKRDESVRGMFESSSNAAETGKTDDKVATGDKPRAAEKADANKDGDASVTLERKATAGDTQALVVARKKSDSSDAGSAGGGQKDGLQSMPTMPQGAFNPMAPSPQSMQTANSMPPPLPQAGMIAPQLVDLIRNNVKQMLISDGRSSRLRSREVLLRMQDDTLPGTDLWLTQTDGGWHLRADISSREGYDTLMANKDELIRRFADQALGELSIEPIYHD